MSGPDEKRLAAALQPLISRLRTDDTVRKGAKGQYRSGEPLTPERLEQHLNGGPVRGCYVMQAGSSMTMVGVLDLDSHKGETPWHEMTAAAQSLMLSVELMGGEAVAFRSSGGKGVHLYCLWEAPQDAYSVRMWLTDVLTSCGFTNGSGGVAAGEVEVFPKADNVAEGKFGAQVILPLGGQSVPLVYEPLLDDLVEAPRETVLEWVWPMSAPVPVREKPVRTAPGTEEVSSDLAGVRDALQAIVGAVLAGVAEPLGHDPWRTLVQAVGRASAGSEEGRELAHWFSAAIPDYDAERCDEVWDTSDHLRADGVGLGTVLRMARELAGWSPPLDDSGFEVVPDERPAAVPVASVAVLKRLGIPEAHHLTTDQANANRLVRAFGRQVLVAAGRWHAWDGQRWAADEANVYRYGCRLSELIRVEAQAIKAKASVLPDPAAIKKAAAIAEALGKWAAKSEMKGTIEAAIGLARKMLTVDAGALDADPWALNVSNGIVDLRTGALRPHNPDELITKLAPVAYVEGALCPTWDRVLSEATRGDTELLAFLGRWFGYCLTGVVTEQAFVVHWGTGSNGKSTVLDTLAEVMGDYAGVAAPGLLAASRSGGDRHPTEIASLMGRRMVTSHESGEGVVLREDFIKQATGGDKLTARYMREDFFTFSPTHKIQLLTNHKPAIKGQDRGIWRRVLLVPYLASFGTAAQVKEGSHSHVRDEMMVERLRGEREGVLAWLVRGVLAWQRDGLAAPGVVLAASAAYKSEQDRVGQFVDECCETGTGEGFEEALTEPMGGGLYPAYTAWCKDGGVFPLSKMRFTEDVLRVTGGGETVSRYSSVKDGKRRKLTVVRGLRLLSE